ncbi:MAG: hypothetical protein IPF58_10870 [Saprospirales bacterium]|nr:hypothetical protein [Saprospirales bacterium]
MSFTDIEDVFVEKFTDENCTTYMHEGNLKETEIIEEKIFIKDEKCHTSRKYIEPFMALLYQILLAIPTKNYR